MIVAMGNAHVCLVRRRHRHFIAADIKALPGDYARINCAQWISDRLGGRPVCWLERMHAAGSVSSQSSWSQSHVLRRLVTPPSTRLAACETLVTRSHKWQQTNDQTILKIHIGQALMFTHVLTLRFYSNNAYITRVTHPDLLQRRPLLVMIRTVVPVDMYLIWLCNVLGVGGLTDQNLQLKTKTKTVISKFVEFYFRALRIYALTRASGREIVLRVRLRYTRFNPWVDMSGYKLALSAENLLL